MKRISTALFLVLLTACIGFAQIKTYTLTEAKVDANNDFIPDHKVAGDTLLVRGVVYTPNINKTTASSYYLTDGFTGINFYYSAKNFAFSSGDMIRVVGKIDHYNGMTEIVPLNDTCVTVFSQGAPIPAAKEVTIAQLKSNGELYESSLLIIKNLSKASGTWPAAGAYATLKVTDGKDTLDCYINKYTDLSASAEPTWPQDITGMGTQYSKTPFSSGYQIYPRTIADFTAPVVPVELTSFEASVNASNVNLKWQTVTETNNACFEVYRNGVKIAVVKGNGTTSEKKNYVYSDKNLSTGKYSYKLVQVDLDGTKKTVASTEASINNIPTSYSVDQNYPNPFNPSTSIRFALPADAKVTLKIYNILGQQVAQLVNGTLSAGQHDAKFDASRLNSGIYMYSIQAKGIDGSQFSSTKKMMLVK